MENITPAQSNEVQFLGKFGEFWARRYEDEILLRLFELTHTFAFFKADTYEETEKLAREWAEKHSPYAHLVRWAVEMGFNRSSEDVKTILESCYANEAKKRKES